MIKTVEQAKDHLVNKTMIGWHILGYTLIIIGVISYLFTDISLNTVRFYEASIYFVLASNFVCTIIFGLIINQIRSKAKQSETPSITDSSASSQENSVRDPNFSLLLEDIETDLKKNMIETSISNTSISNEDVEAPEIAPIPSSTRKSISVMESAIFDIIFKKIEPKAE